MMRRRLLATALTVAIAISLIPVVAMAEDTLVTFEATNGQGVSIKYSIISEPENDQNGSVRVGITEAAAVATAGGDGTAKKHDPNTRAVADNDSGELIIPAVVEHDSKMYNVVEIGYCAFRGRNNLTKIVIPDSVTKLDSMAFSACAELLEVVVPQSITEIGTYMFANSTKLTKADFPSSTNITAVPDGTYSNTDIRNVTLGDHITNIGGNAFKNCSNLVLTTLPPRLSYIGYQAFYVTDYKYTDAMKQDITLSVPVELGNQAFARSGFTSITVSNLTSLGTWAFANSPNLTEVVLPDTVTTLPAGTFASTKFQTYRIPSQVTKIDAQAFLNCAELHSVFVHKEVQTIGDDAFYGLAKGSIVYAEKNTLVSSLIGGTSRTNKNQVIHYDSSKTAIAATNGGTFPADTVFLKEALDIPFKSGFTFVGWYGDDAFTSSLTGAPAAGSTYYAKWYCADAGSHDFEGNDCKNCDFVKESVDSTSGTCANGHTWGQEATVTTQPTCTADGTKTYACTTDGCTATKTEYIPALGHSFTNYVETSAATCITKGIKTATCDRCTETHELYTAYGAHSYTSTVTHDPTYTDEGVRTYTCSVCGDSYTESIPKLVQSSGGSSAPSYSIAAPETDNGTMKLSSASAKAGRTVTVTATPDEGYQLAALTVLDKNGDPVEVTDKGDGTYTFKMPAGKVTVEATFEPIPPLELPFTDVNESDWFYDSVWYAYFEGLMTGTSDTTFDPTGTTTRAMTWTILGRLAGETIEGSTWDTDAQAWAMATGVSDGTAPNDPVTREQLITMLYRFVDTPSGSADLSQFVDNAAISPYAQYPMSWAVSIGLLQGDDQGLLNSTATATRAEVSTILMRFCEAAV